MVTSHCCLICISLKINDVGHLFMCLFATHRSSLVNCPNFLPIFKNAGVFSPWVLRVLYISLDTSPLSNMIYNFIPVCGLSLHSLNSFFRRAKFWCISIYQCFLLWTALFMSTLRNLYLTQGHKDFPLCFLLEIFIVLGFTFRSMICF